MGTRKIISALLRWHMLRVEYTGQHRADEMNIKTQRTAVSLRVEHGKVAWKPKAPQHAVRKAVA